MPKVSVLLTSYNHGKYISEALKSILAQDYDDFELVIIDDSSQDNSVNIIKEIISGDKRVRLFTHDVNLGMVATVNEGISLCSGQYIAHMNSDDIWCDTSKLKKQAAFLDENGNYGAVFTGVNLINEKGKSIEDKGLFSKAINRNRHSWLKRFFFHSNEICYSSSMVRKQVFNEVGLYNERFSVLLDLDMWIRICRKYEIRILQDITMNFRVGKNSESYNKIKLGDFEFLKVLNSFLDISYEEFLKIFTPKDESKINKDNYLGFLFYICCYYSRTHLRFAVDKLWSSNCLGGNGLVSFYEFRSLVKKSYENPFFDPFIKGEGAIYYLYKKVFHLNKYLGYKAFKKLSKNKIESLIHI